MVQFRREGHDPGAFFDNKFVLAPCYQAFAPNWPAGVICRSTILQKLNRAVNAA